MPFCAYTCVNKAMMNDESGVFFRCYKYSTEPIPLHPLPIAFFLHLGWTIALIGRERGNGREGGREGRQTEAENR